MTEKEAIEKLNKLQGTDQEAEHGVADDILVEFLKTNSHEELAHAFEECAERVVFWYA